MGEGRGAGGPFVMRASGRDSIVLVTLACALVGLCGATCEQQAGEAEVVSKDGVYTVRGTLTAEGVECPAMRSDKGNLFTLSGSLGEFKPGDKVCVRGRAAEMSFCQQGTTLAVEWIGRECPK